MSTARKYDDVELPEGWRTVRLDAIADVIGGSTPSRSRDEFWGGSIPWVVPSEITSLSGRCLTYTNECITEAGLQAAGLKILPAGSVLLTSRATIGAAAINTRPVATNQGFQNLVAKDGTNSVWLYYCISSMRRELDRRAAGSTFAEISRDNVRSLPILYPPLPEQRAIADVLDSIDVAIERTEAVIAATETLRDALLHELLTRGVPGWHTEWKDVPGIGTIPANWDVVRLGEVATVRNGTTPSRKHEPYWDNGDVPFVKTGRVNDVFIREPDEFITLQAVMNAGAVMVPEGSILIAMIGQGKTRGMTARLGFSAAINQNFAAVYEPSLGFDLDYFFSWASHNYVRIRGLGQGSNQDALNCELIQRMQFPVPPISEQQVIVGLLEGVAKSLAEAKKEQGSLQSLKHSTADTLLTGRTRLENRNE